jgi:hypothetical protein
MMGLETTIPAQIIQRSYKYDESYLVRSTREWCALNPPCQCRSSRAYKNMMSPTSWEECVSWCALKQQCQCQSSRAHKKWKVLYRVSSTLNDVPWNLRASASHPELIKNEKSYTVWAALWMTCLETYNKTYLVISSLVPAEVIQSSLKYDKSYLVRSTTMPAEVIKSL